jgi:hypothetical protein
MQHNRDQDYNNNATMIKMVMIKIKLEDHDYAQQDQHNHDQCTRTPSQPRLKPKDPISTKNNATMIPMKGQ